MINITVTFSYAVCIVCEELSYLPALGQMATLVDAMMNPESYGHLALAIAMQRAWGVTVKQLNHTLAGWHAGMRASPTL